MDLPLEVRDALMKQCMRLPTVHLRLMVLVSVWQHLLPAEDEHGPALMYLTVTALQSPSANADAAFIAYRAALGESLKSARTAGTVEAEIQQHRERLQELDEMVQCGGSPEDPELKRLVAALDVEGIERLLRDPKRGQH